MDLLLILTTCGVLFGTSFSIPINQDDLLAPIAQRAEFDLDDLDDTPAEKVIELLAWLSKEKHRSECPIPNTVQDSAASCPLREVIDVDYNRIPVKIPKAVCRCNGCHDSSSSERTTGLGVCQEVIKPVIVYRRMSEDKPYVMDIELVPSACVCNTSSGAGSEPYEGYLESKAVVTREWLNEQPKDCSGVKSGMIHNSVSHSQCPWVIDHPKDGNRIPRRIQRAVCQCESCTAPEGSTAEWGCREVLTPVRVARRAGFNEPYYLDTEMVPTTCVCQAL